MAKPEFHIFVCGQRRPAGHPRGSCGAKGVEALYDAFARALTQRNLHSRIALTSTGCLGPCQAGANWLAARLSKAGTAAAALNTGASIALCRVD